MASLLIVYGTMFAGIALLVLQTELQRSKARKVGTIAPKASRKHCRITVWTDSVSISYYNAKGRKVTTRRAPMADYGHLIAMARSKGYRTI